MMTKIARYRLAPEAYPYLLALLLGGVTLHFLDLFVGWVVWCALALAMAFAFRDSVRDIPALPLAVLSPIDGVVVSVAQFPNDAIFGGGSVRIDVQGKWLGGFALLGPTEGKVHRYWLEDGRQWVWIKTDEDDDVAVGLERSRITNRSRIYVPVGQRVGQGRRLGFASVASSMTIVVGGMPKIEVKPETRLRAGETVLATLRH